MNGTRWMAVLVLGLVACGGANASGPAPETHANQPANTAEVKAPGVAKVGERSTCPVSHEEFTISAQSPKVDYKGKTYYFCCSGCDQKFKENPEKYLAPQGT